jgi:hypothetical protein
MLGAQRCILENLKKIFSVYQRYLPPITARYFPNPFLIASPSYVFTGKSTG